MQKIRIECQSCESVQDIESEGLLLITRTPDGQGETICHEMDEVEALINAGGYLPRKDLIELILRLLDILKKLDNEEDKDAKPGTN